MSQTVLGFDVGLRRTGMAVGQSITGTASALPVLACQNGQPDWERVGAVISEWRPDALIVGIPLQMDGTEQPMTKTAERFARQLEGRYGLPCHRVDERLSSREAEAEFARQRRAGTARRKQAAQLDSVAASLIVERWLNAG